MKALLLLLLMLSALAFAQENQLFYLARDSNYEEVMAAIASGANVNARDAYGQTPLMYAAEHNQVEVVRTLVQAGADPNARSDAGWSPLAYAFRNQRHPEMPLLLLDLGANATALQYGHYVVPELGYELVYPAGILEPQASNAGEQAFLAEDGRARMVVYSRPSSESLDTLYRGASASSPDREVTYRVLGPGWFVVSGYEQGRIFYQKTFLSNGIMTAFALEYDPELRAIFDRVTEQVSWSFKPSEVPPLTSRLVERPPAVAQAAALPVTPQQEPPSSSPIPSQQGHAEGIEAEMGVEVDVRLEAEVAEEFDQEVTEGAAVEPEVQEPDVLVAGVPAELPQADAMTQVLSRLSFTPAPCAAHVEAQAMSGGSFVLCGHTPLAADEFMSLWNISFAEHFTPRPLSDWFTSGNAFLRAYTFEGQLLIRHEDGLVHIWHRP